MPEVSQAFLTDSSDVYPGADAFSIQNDGDHLFCWKSPNRKDAPKQSKNAPAPQPALPQGFLAKYHILRKTAKRRGKGIASCARVGEAAKPVKATESSLAPRRKAFMEMSERPFCSGENFWSLLVKRPCWGGTTCANLKTQLFKGVQKEE